MKRCLYMCTSLSMCVCLFVCLYIFFLSAVVIFCRSMCRFPSSVSVGFLLYSLLCSLAPWMPCTLAATWWGLARRSIAMAGPSAMSMAMGLDASPTDILPGCCQSMRKFPAQRISRHGEFASVTCGILHTTCSHTGEPAIYAWRAPVSQCAVVPGNSWLKALCGSRLSACFCFA
jgi:hypothetical protein